FLLQRSLCSGDSGRCVLAGWITDDRAKSCGAVIMKRSAKRPFVEVHEPKAMLIFTVEFVHIAGRRNLDLMAMPRAAVKGHILGREHGVGGVVDELAEFAEVQVRPLWVKPQRLGKARRSGIEMLTEHDQSLFDFIDAPIRGIELVSQITHWTQFNLRA